MGNVFHKNFVGDDNHALTSRIYTDIAERDADTEFQVAVNIDKVVRVDTPASYYLLLSVGPTVWSEAANGPTVHAQLSDSVNQEPTTTTPTVITYGTQDAVIGLTHSTTVNPGELTINIAGAYFIMSRPQVGKASGGSAHTFDMFMQVDRGSGFVDEVNTNTKFTVKDAGVTDVVVFAFSISLKVNDKIRMMQRVSSSSVGLGLKATAAESGPPTIPATPSVLFTIRRTGD